MIECPKCKHEHKPSGDSEDDCAEWECGACEHRFIVSIDYTPSYSSSCVEHSRGSPRPFKNGGKEFNIRDCEHCGDMEVDPKSPGLNQTEVVPKKPTKVICPSCGTQRGYAFGTGDCGCACSYKMMTEEQFTIMFPVLENPFQDSN